MVRWLLLLLALFAAAPGLAHPTPFTYLDLDLRSDGIKGSLTIHVFDAAHGLGVQPPERLLDPDVLQSVAPRLEALMAQRLAITGPERLQPHWTGATALTGRNGIRLTFDLPGARPAALGLDTSLFPYDPVHQTFVNIYEGGTLRQQWIFDRTSSPRTFYAGSTAGRFAVLRTFVPAGIHHILIGPDHLLFLVGLLLLGGRFGQLVRIVTAFTLGHSVTLSLAALDLVTPPSTIVEPAIALTIVVVGVDNLLRGEGKDFRAWAALAFGLIHGFGFASVLREFGLPREALGWSLFGFNLGVEIGQLIVVIPVATLLNAIWRSNRDLGYRVAQVGSLVVVAAGGYWFIERIMFPGGA